MHSAILAIGDELTIGQRTNTNAVWLAGALAEHGVITDEHRTVGDDRIVIANAIRELSDTYPLLVLIGGLGPTEDDLTRFALGDVVTPGELLMHDDAAEQALRERYRRHQRTMPESNLRQALRPGAMEFIPNPHGTAMGLAGTIGACRVFALPGPPQEMKAMVRDHVLPLLADEVEGHVLRTASVHEFGLGESDAAERLGDLTRRDHDPAVGLTVSESIVSAQVRIEGKVNDVEHAVCEMIAEIQRRWHPYAYGKDDQTLPAIVGALLLENNRTLMTAESCTGGWLGKSIVDIAGSSAYYLGGWVTYTDALKRACLDVPVALLETHGAVSPQVAEAMACGALRHSHADFALAITGIAGPEGGSEEKPVGTVYITLAARPSGKEENHITCETRHFVFTGDRATVRDRSVKSALQMLRFQLLELHESPSILWQRTPATKHINPIRNISAECDRVPEKATKRRSDEATKG